MPLPYVSENLLAEGFRCYVRIGTNASDAEIVGFVESFSMNEDYQVQEARVIGQLMPIAIDAQGYSCSISLSGFIPSKKVYDRMKGGTAQMGYSLKNSLFTYAPDAREMIDSNTVVKYPYLDFIDCPTNKNIICSAEGIIVGNFSITAQSTGYVKGNVTMRALVGQKGYK
ncbi:hypothetical protein [Treponema pedis]|uniref:hypothetical protein n=2 Tax=Treponema pedis TaxID=409322 RepID=UPI0004218EF0|nr:hypothetical protein [Treponema pedis]